MPARKEDAHRALELLEDYYSRLSAARPQDQQLKQAVEQVIKIFKSSLFQALLDIHEFYETTLMNDGKSVQQKTREAQLMSSKFQNAPFGVQRHDSAASSSSLAAGSDSVAHILQADAGASLDAANDRFDAHPHTHNPPAAAYDVQTASLNSASPPLPLPAYHSLNRSPTAFSYTSPSPSNSRISAAHYASGHGPSQSGVGSHSSQGVNGNEEPDGVGSGPHSRRVSVDTNGLPLADFVQSPYDELEIILERGPLGLGFSIAGGNDQPRTPNDPAVYISKIVEGCAAHLDGRMRLGDILAQINDDEVLDVEHQMAADALKKAGNIVTLRLRRRRGPLLRLAIDKGSRGLGISIAGGLANQHVPGDDGIFVTKIVEGGAAALDGRLRAGDKLVAVGETRLDHVQHDVAVSLLKNSGQTVQLLVERPTAEAEGGSGATSPGARNEASFQRVQTQSSVSLSESSAPKEGSRSRTPSRSERADSSDYSGPAYGMAVRAPIAALEEEHAEASRELRSVVLTKGPQGLGFNIVGGEEGEGIYLSYIVPGGSCDLNGKLRRGDRLISVNGINLRHASHEEAADALKGAGQTVTIVAQYCPEEYQRFEEKIEELKEKMMSASSNSLRPTQKRSLYVRSQIDYDPSRDSGLPSRGLAFVQGDILHVTNASDDEWWQARRVNWRGQEEGLGIIPSKQRVERKERARLKSVKFEASGEGGSKSASTSTLDRLTGRKKDKEKDKEKDNNSGNKSTTPNAASKKFAFFKSGKEHSGDETSESEKVEEAVASYEPVVYERLKYVRPVIIMGPFKDRINDDLIAEQPERFSSCVPHTTRPRRDHELDGRDYHFVTREQMERDIQNHLFIEAGQYSDNLYGTSVAAVRQVADKGLHCVLDVSGAAVRRLHANGLYPVVVYVKPKSLDSIMEMNRRLSEEMAHKSLERCAKLEKEFGHLFTATVTGDTPEELYLRVKEVIEREAAGDKAWIPSKERI